MNCDRNIDDKMSWYLESVTDAGKNWLVTIDSVPFIIGRSNDCDLKLTNQRISRQHSEIRISSGMLWIRDLESTNGTFVNKKRVEQAELLEPDDIISIGDYEFRLKKDQVATSDATNETMFSTLSKEIRDISFFEPSLQQLINERNVIPHFQPIVRFSDMTEVGYEILGRIIDKDLPSNPAELLDVAENLGYGSDLSALFREVGVEIGKKLPGLPSLFVNTTRFELFQIDSLLQSLKKMHDFAPSNKIVLEINEKAATGTDNLPELKDALKNMGMGLAFDDFGVGQTRLVELSNISPDYLKFDISLICQIHLAPKRLHQMISTFIKASHDLGILTIAEGIECAEEAEVCRVLGFDLGQGYLFGRPSPFDAIEINSLRSKAILNSIRLQDVRI